MILKYIWGHLKKLGIPLLISYIFCWFTFFELQDWSRGVLRYLWFIHVMIICDTVIFIIRRYIKKETIFNIVLASMIVLGLALELIFYETFHSMSDVKVLIYIPLGYFLTYLNRFKFQLPLLIGVPLSLLILIGMWFFVYIGDYLYVELGLGLIILPLLFIIIIKTKMPSIRIFNFLGKISLEIYVYQCVVRFFINHWNLNHLTKFLFVIALVAMSEIIRYTVSTIKNNQKLLIVNS